MIILIVVRQPSFFIFRTNPFHPRPLKKKKDLPIWHIANPLDIFINLMIDIGSWEIMTLRCFGFVFGHPSNFLLYNFIVKNSPRLNINIGVLGMGGWNEKRLS